MVQGEATESSLSWTMVGVIHPFPTNTQGGTSLGRGIILSQGFCYFVVPNPFFEWVNKDDVLDVFCHESLRVCVHVDV